jgi:hypothetical protein
VDRNVLGSNSVKPVAGALFLFLSLAACSSSPLVPTGAAGMGGTGTAGTGTAITGEAGTGAPTDGTWIYVATAKGLERIKAAGGAFETFGVEADTLSVFPSPSGKRVAQELADGRVAVFDDTGARQGAFDVRRGLLGWSDEDTLLFLDPETKFLQQTSVDGQLRRYLPLPDGVNAYGYTNARLSPDHGLIAAFAEPWAKDNIAGSYLFVLSATDGTRIRDLGVPYGGGVWTGDGRLFVETDVGLGDLVDPRTGTKTSVQRWPTLVSSCGLASWYEPGKIVVGRSFYSGGDQVLCAQAVIDLPTGATTPADEPRVETPDLGPFALSPDNRQAAVATFAELSLAAVKGGTPKLLGVAMDKIVGIGWAHPLPGHAKFPPLPLPPPTNVPGAAGAPSTASRSGGTDCATGRWVNRTPAPLPVGWPASRTASSFAFDTDRGTLLVEGGLAGNLGTLPDLGYETLEWDGAQGQWTNLSRPDGYGPTMGRALAYDAHHKLVLGQGTDLFADGPWTWTQAGWRNLRSTEPYGRPIRLSNAATVYDLARDRWIVSGGYVTTLTWEWDGTAWVRTEAGLPGGNATQAAGARLVYDSRRARVYSVGNRDRGPAPWLYEPDQKTWTAQPSTGPSALPRDWAGVAYDARRDRVMVFGGLVVSTQGGGMVADLSEWDPATGAWRQCADAAGGPGPRMNAAFAYDPRRDVLVLYGGDTPTGTPATDVWEWYVP